MARGDRQGERADGGLRAVPGDERAHIAEFNPPVRKCELVHGGAHDLITVRIDAQPVPVDHGGDPVTVPQQVPVLAVAVDPPERLGRIIRGGPPVLLRGNEFEAFAKDRFDGPVERVGMFPPSDPIKVVADPLPGRFEGRHLHLGPRGRAQAGRRIGQRAVDAADDGPHVEGPAAVHLGTSRMGPLDPRGEVVVMPADLGDRLPGDGRDSLGHGHARDGELRQQCKAAAGGVRVLTGRLDVTGNE